MPSPYSNEEYHEGKPWWDQPKTWATWYHLKPPYNNVVVGCDPRDGMTKEDAQQFDAIVNVSSTKCATFMPARPDQRTYWFPIIEMGRWPVVYLLWLKEVMDYHHKQGHKIYLHCHAGAFRSPSAAILWMESRGHTIPEALDLCNERSEFFPRAWERQGNLPLRKNALWPMFRKQQEEYDKRGYGELCIESILYYDADRKSKPLRDHEIMSGKHRIEHILREVFWFYYRPKYWLNNQWRTFKEWAFERRGRITTGKGSSCGYTRKHFFARMEKAEPLGTNKVGEYAWINKRWNKTSEYDLTQKKWIWLVEKCPHCDGRAVTIDESKPFGKGHAHCEACNRTGVKDGVIR